MNQRTSTFGPLRGIGLAAAVFVAVACSGDDDTQRDGSADGGELDTDVADAAGGDASDVSDAVNDAGEADGDAAIDAASDAATDTADTAPDAEPSGVPINRGAPEVDVQGTAGVRIEPMTYTVPALEVERTLDLHFWYATDDTEGEPAVFTLIIDDYAWMDATVSPPSEPAPLMVYSHGGRGFSGQISPVARQFARNGWIVIAPSHPGDNLFETEPSQPYSFPAIRAYDVLAAIDRVENLPSDHPLAGRIDTSRVLTMGHSYGGQNAWILNGLAFGLDGLRERCGDGCTPEDLEAYESYTPDPRVVAGVSMDCTMDANLVPDEGYADVAAPMLHLSGTEGNHAAGIFERAAAADLTWVSLEGGCHESFTGTLPCDTLPLEESLAATAAYTLAFGARHVLGSDDAEVLGLLDGSVQWYESASVTRTDRAAE